MTADGRIRQQPGLEGLRGLAVAAVVVFHIGRGWLPGGYLGVSLFFTISGVVIGSVLLAEIERTGRMSVGHFFARRARRLYPAAWLVLAAVAVLRVTTTVAVVDVGRRHRDVVAAGRQLALPVPGHVVRRPVRRPLGRAALLEPGHRGAALPRHRRRDGRDRQVLAAPGPDARHAGRRRRPRVVRPARSCSALDVDHTYYGTGTRAGEVFVGLVLAAVIADRDRRVWLLARIRPIIVARHGGPARHDRRLAHDPGRIGR